jgi:hypothetical protein
MKANLKGLSGIKGLLLMHGEKLGIAVVALLALWFIYSSLSAPRLQPGYQASKLEEQINQANATVRDSKWPAPDSEAANNVRIAPTEVAQKADLTVNSKHYDIGGYGFTPVIPPTQRRTDPPLLNAVEARAKSGSGLFAFVDEEIRRQQELKRRQLEEERVKAAEKLAQQQQQQAEQGRQGRRGRDQGEMAAAPFDPEHPNRRMVQGATRPAGVPLQGGERIERAYWATVVAKVPIREQLKLYQDSFENARGYNPASDFPIYKGYMVQRAEVVRGKPLEWKSVGVYDAQRRSIDANKPLEPVVSEKAVSKLYDVMSKDWAGQPMDPVDSRYTDQMLTLPLPPLVGRDWGADATHPDIPLAINAPPPEAEEPLVEQAVEQPTADPDDPASLFRSDPNQQPLGQRPGGFSPGMGRFPGGERGGYGPGYGYGEMGMRGYPSPEMMGSMGEGYRGGYTGPGGQPGVLPRGVDFKLLRFFDFTVDPGKKYKYRVKLVLADPNYGLPDSTLDPAVQDRLRASKKRDFRIAEEWSEPTPTVGIPLMGVVQLAEAKQPSGKNFNDEPSVKLMVETFAVDTDGTAVHVAKEKDYRRGYVVNLKEKMEYTGDGDRWIDTFDQYEINTGVTLLDVTGGARLTKDMTVPGRVLLMDASGELSIRKELDDSASIEYLRLLFAEDKRRPGEEGMMPGMPFGAGRNMMQFPGGQER